MRRLALCRTRARALPALARLRALRCARSVPHFRAHARAHASTRFTRTWCTRARATRTPRAAHNVAHITLPRARASDTRTHTRTLLRRRCIFTRAARTHLLFACARARAARTRAFSLRCAARAHARLNARMTRTAHFPARAARAAPLRLRAVIARARTQPRSRILTRARRSARARAFAQTAIRARDAHARARA